MGQENSDLMKGDDRILVTGGCGYIGSHTVIELLKKGYKVIIIDNLCNSDPSVIDKIIKVCKSDGDSTIPYEKNLVACTPIDLCDVNKVEEEVFKRYAPFKCCIHFAALKAVGESVRIPLDYYRNNIDSTLNLLTLLKKYECRNLVFSSSGAVYGDQEPKAITEDSKCSPISPYGKTKWMAEMILNDLAISEPGKWNILNLRYFNPVGAHPSGFIGENPKGIPNNLLPIICQVATGISKNNYLSIFGNDWNTRDGTCIRDYIHICDLAEAHVEAVKTTISSSQKPFGCEALNLGTGSGTTVLEIIGAFEKASGLTMPKIFVERRPGDVESLFADVTKAQRMLNWKAKRTIHESCADAWRYIKNSMATDQR